MKKLLSILNKPTKTCLGLDLAVFALIISTLFEPHSYYGGGLLLASGVIFVLCLLGKPKCDRQTA